MPLPALIHELRQIEDALRQGRQPDRDGTSAATADHALAALVRHEQTIIRELRRRARPPAPIRDYNGPSGLLSGDTQ